MKATIMAILESTDITHPAIEALFTIDEETGMTGAMGLKGGLLSGGILLNLDTEEDDEIGVGCAGGIDVTATRAYEEEETPEFLVQLLLEQWCHRNFKLQYLSLEIITEMVDYTTTHTQ